MTKIMAIVLWIVGAFLLMVSIRTGWPALKIVRSLPESPIAYELAINDVQLASQLLIAGLLALVGGTIVWAIIDGGKPPRP
jgi:hypothetical protein